MSDIFLDIFSEALVRLYRAKEFSGLLPAVSVSEDRPKRKIVLEFDGDTWEVYERLATVLSVPPNVLVTALATASALTLLEKYDRQSR